MDYGTTFANSGINGALPGDPSPLTGSGQSGGTNGQLQTALQQLQDAINSGNQRQYDLAVAGLTGVLNGQQTLNYGTLMGTLNGQPTLAAEEALGSIGGKPTLDAQKLAETERQYNLTQGQDLLKTAAGLTGPRDYGDFMAFTGGGKNLYQQALSGRPASSAPQGDMEPMDMAALLQKLGMGPGQGAGAVPAAPAAVPGGGGAQDDSSDPQTAMNQLYAAIMGGLASRPSGMDVGGGGTDPAGTPDYSQFPTMANPGDLAYAKSGATFDPTGYRDYMTANGYTADAMPASAAATPAAADSSDALGQFLAQHRPDVVRSGWMTGANINPVSRPSNMTTLQGFQNWWSNNAHGDNSDGLGRSLQDYANSIGFTAPTAAATTTAPAALQSWLPDYIKALQALGPDVNQGAAENLALLHQLGADNPGGLQMLRNPTGNITPAYWDQLGATGQSLMAQAAGKVFGWTPSDFLQQIDAQRPVGAGYTPGTTGVQMAPLGSL